jgi:hypothetical protein
MKERSSLHKQGSDQPKQTKHHSRALRSLSQHHPMHSSPHNSQKPCNPKHNRTTPTSTAMREKNVETNKKKIKVFGRRWQQASYNGCFAHTFVQVPSPSKRRAFQHKTPPKIVGTSKLQGATQGNDKKHTISKLLQLFISQLPNDGLEYQTAFKTFSSSPAPCLHLAMHHTQTP